MSLVFSTIQLMTFFLFIKSTRMYSIIGFAKLLIFSPTYFFLIFDNKSKNFPKHSQATKNFLNIFPHRTLKILLTLTLSETTVLIPIQVINNPQVFCTIATSSLVILHSNFLNFSFSFVFFSILFFSSRNCFFIFASFSLSLN